MVKYEKVECPKRKMIFRNVKNINIANFYPDVKQAVDTSENIDKLLDFHVC